MEEDGIDSEAHSVRGTAAAEKVLQNIPPLKDST